MQWFQAICWTNVERTLPQWDSNEPTGLALLVSPADRPSLLGAGYALSEGLIACDMCPPWSPWCPHFDVATIIGPSSVRLKLAHVPSDQTLRLQFEVATQEVTKVNFQRSQVMQLGGDRDDCEQILAVRSAQAEEVARLYRLMVPLEQENEILQVDQLKELARQQSVEDVVDVVQVSKKSPALQAATARGPQSQTKSYKTCCESRILRLRLG
eukprot:s1100_g6.t1